MIAPAEFIPIAEETGLIVPIGEWILVRHGGQAARWPEHVSVARKPLPCPVSSIATW